MAFAPRSAGLLRDYGGTARIADPEETLRNLEQVRRLVGISRLANITGLDSAGIPTWMAIRPLARSVTVSQGKGISHAAAKVSAIMEAAELFHAEHLLPAGDKVTLAEAARSRRFVDISFLPIRDSADLSPERPVRWIAGKCLISGNAQWYPRQIIDLDLVDRDGEAEPFTSSSNGLASGNSLEEATIHAICEVMERDHCTFFQMKENLAPYLHSNRLKLGTISDPDCRHVLAKIEQSGLKCAIWSVADEPGVPSFTCDIYDADNATPYPVRASGAGCHPRKRIALLRALTEALQSRLTFIAGARDDLLWKTYRKDIPVTALANKIWMEQRQYEAELVDFETINDFGSGTDDPHELVDELLAALETCGFNNVIRTDLTSDPINIPVVHVFIPGMEPRIETDSYCPGPRMMKFLEEIIQS
ncbi:MAG: YcaO-like family protein [Alphaproteobacteria bacterium]